MSDGTSAYDSWLLNLALLVLGLVLLALLYGLVSRSFGGGRPPATPAEAGESVPGEAAGSTQTGAAERPVAEEESAIVQVGVRNGCGVEGLAATARHFLVRRGFDVVDVGNHSSFDVDSSAVLDRVGDRATARRVARALGMASDRVRQESGTGYYLDATVLLGCDYRSLTPFAEKTLPTGSR